MSGGAVFALIMFVASSLLLIRCRDSSAVPDALACKLAGSHVVQTFSPAQCDANRAGIQDGYWPAAGLRVAWHSVALKGKGSNHSCISAGLHI